ncbi:17177_t:CDS:2 [Funneliformis caledonium]|uniref:17177_t:CDS:1 n=1 Tax=Funneliformis caledonium TaxID=1117310 RepID=A0A9N9GKK2_9GLOM|nr:17177_t:CDS:2 [Funneliformis caledonium]
MYGWSFELQEIAKLLLNSEYKEFKDDENREIPEQVRQTSPTQSFASKIFGPPQTQLSIDNEIVDRLN